MLFFITCEILDGEHEHLHYSVQEFKSLKEAERKTKPKLDRGGLDSPNSIYGFGDGLTATRVRGIQEITPEEYAVMKKFMSV